MVKYHINFCFIMLFSLFLGGCSLGSEFQDYQHLTKESFPSLKDVPFISEQDQKKERENLKKCYLKDKQRLEKERSILEL